MQGGAGPDNAGGRGQTCPHCSSCKSRRHAKERCAGTARKHATCVEQPARSVLKAACFVQWTRSLYPIIHPGSLQPSDAVMPVGRWTLHFPHRKMTVSVTPLTGYTAYWAALVLLHLTCLGRCPVWVVSGYFNSCLLLHNRDLSITYKLIAGLLLLQVCNKGPDRSRPLHAQHQPLATGVPRQASSL